MKIKTEYPYSEYNGYLIVNRENRRHICLILKTDRKIRTTISYARYLMSVKECRILSKEEQVDHRDGDKTNDVIENLQILSILENNRKRFIEQNTTKKMIEMSCPNCGISFVREERNTHIAKKGYYTSCSKSCQYSVLRKKFNVKELIEIGKNQILRRFRN